MNKNLIMGIGGTGLSALREVRRLIAERYERGLGDDAVSSTRFLYIDTSSVETKNHTWSVLGKDIALKDGERVIITGDKLGDIVEKPGDYPAFDAWLPRIKDYIGDPGDGAKGIRPYGRMIYEHPANKQQVEKKCKDLINDLDHNHPKVSAWRFYLVCGLSGGTGSGMFLPLSLDLIAWNLYARGEAGRKFLAFLILPPLDVYGRHNRYHANAYAALSELNYFAVGNPEGGVPRFSYDYCYLVEPQNEKGLRLNLENLPLLIAQRIFLNIQGGPAAAKVDGLVDNPQELGRTDGEDESGAKRAMCFSGFGLSAVSYPREAIAKCLSYKVASNLVRGWLAERDSPQNVHEIAMTELRSMRLSLQHIFGDSDPFGTKDYPDHSVEITNLVGKKIDGLPKKQLGDSAETIRLDIETNFREVGIARFYRTRIDDLEGAASEAVKQVRVKVSAYLGDPGYGLIFAKKFLEELEKILTEFKTQVSGLVGEAQQNQITRRLDNLKEMVTLIRANEQKVLYFGGNFRRDQANLEDGLKQYLRKFTDSHAAKYAVQLLDRVIPEVKSIRSFMDNWQHRLEDAGGTLTGKLHTILEDMSKGTQENGSVIFDEATLDGLLQEASPGTTRQAVEELVRQKLGQRSLDLVELGRIENAEDILRQAAYDWVLSDDCPINVRRLNLYDRFVAKYPVATHRRELLRQVRDLSGAFSKFSASERGRRGIQLIEPRVTSIPPDTGQAASDGRPTQALIKEDLKAVGAPEEEVKIADDPERIVFLQEKHGFPIRWIESVGYLKKQYDSFESKDALHIDRRIVPDLYGLYILTLNQRQDAQRAEAVFLISRVLGWLAKSMNRHTRQEEVHFEFEGAIGTEKYAVGPDWESAMKLFVEDAASERPANPQARQARLLLTKKVRELMAEPGNSDQQALPGLLKKYLVS